MSETTPLDTAHAAMEAAPEDESARLRFYDRLAESELFLLLQSEAKGDQITPEVFDLSDQGFVLAFDRETRLTEFTGRASSYAALSGRTICSMLAPNGMGLGLNLEVAPSSILLPPSAVMWLADTLQNRPEEVEQVVESLFSPKGLPDHLLTALDAKLATAMGLAASAYLVGVKYTSGTQGHMLGFVDPVPGAEQALASAVSEALTFSGLEAAMLDVAFFAASDAMAPQMAKHGLRFDLPQPQRPGNAQPGAPGMNPDVPPRLK
ncbi:SseB family protein [Roseovarius sp. 2305UL8-3]|uniref:SseB family protein n=1 Tax=Roseovarius conchicola TaxID=3121636 RepID=UPI00352919C3